MPDRQPPRSARAHARAAALAVVLARGLARARASCHPVPPATVPMRLVRYERPGSDRRCLVVLLHGRGDRPEDFARHGFLDRLRERHADCDAIAADSHLGYFADRSIGTRLEEDVVAPAHAAGYREIWLVGISLGGLGALIHESEHPGRVTGMVLIAPYLGDGPPIAEIAAAGGAGRWAPPSPIAPDDFVRRLWLFLKATYAAPRVAGGAGAAGAPIPIYLGHGRSDRFAPGQRLLGDLLPPERVTTVPGGHRWGPWEALWRAFLDRGVLPGTTPANDGRSGEGADGTVPRTRGGRR
jgi:pimeloyl-ACP methyl ester carboxylesterase